MHPLVFADDFLTSSLLTLLMPTLLLTAIVIWYVHAVRRHPGNEPVPAPQTQRAQAGEASESPAPPAPPAGGPTQG
ncbi:MAG TPA: hypothetical protein VKV27_01035 [Solirubrobacteraceae bacterium]|nr:hypothetical protein [Solirubrobacteraceae bacterium]